MAVTSRLGITLLDAAQYGKEITANAAFNALDAACAFQGVANTFTQTNTFNGTLAHGGSLLGFYGATPVAQQAQTVDLRTVLITLGLISSSSGATPLSLNGGNFSANQSTLSAGIRGNGGAISFGTSTVAPGSDADYTLTSTEMATGHIILNTGSLTTGRNIILPATTGGFYTIFNNTGFTQTFKTAAGTGVAIAAGKTALVRCGANIVRLTADV